MTPLFAPEEIFFPQAFLGPKGIEPGVVWGNRRFWALLVWPVLVVLGGLGSGLCPAWAVEPTAFRFFRAVNLNFPPKTEEELFAVPLDSEIYRAVQDDFSDIRLFDEESQESPFLLEKASETIPDRTQQWGEPKVDSLRELENNRLEIVLVLPPSFSTADGFQLETPVRDFERRVQVFGSDDGKDWTPLVQEGFLYDYSRFMDVRNTQISLPPNQYTRFKLLIERITESHESPFMEIIRKIHKGEEEQMMRTEYQRTPLRIDRIQAWRWVPRPHQRPKEVDYPVRNIQIHEDPKEKCTIVDLQTHREPLTSLTLKTSSRNFHRKVCVQIPLRQGEATTWTTIAQGTFYVIQFRNFQEEKLKITFPEQRSASYRLVISNQDSPPLKVTGVAVSGVVYQLVFFARKDNRYWVYYGADSVGTPQYDMASVLAPLRSGHPPRLGQLDPKEWAQEPIPPVTDEEPVWRKWLQHPGVLIGVIVLMIAVLGWGLFQAVRRIEQVPQDAPPPQS